MSTRIRRRLREYQGLPADEDFDPADAEQEGSPTLAELDDQLSDYNHARRLREMADLLNKVAAALCADTSTSTTG